jgi:putative peptidoglycan lipid II flippase
MGPGMIGASAVQINLLVDTIIASTLPIGAVSYLYYADRLNQLPLGLIGTAVGTALLPKLAQRIAAKDEGGSLYLFNRALEWTLLLTLPAAVALALIAEPIIAVLFERGEFTAQATLATATALKAYALGLPAFVGVKVLSTALYAQEDTKTPVIITLVCAVVNIMLCLILIRYIAHTGIALATSIAGWLQLAILARLIHTRRHLHFDSQMRRNIVRIFIACTAMGVVLLACHIFSLHYFMAGGIRRMAALVVTMALGGGLFAGLILALKVINLSQIKQSLKGDTQ